MAQGLEFTEEQKEQIIQSITPYLELGFSRNKACEMLGITPSTLSTWVTKDESLRMRLVASENMVNAIAIRNVVDAVKREGELENDIKKENSWKWLERRMKDEFSTRTESTGKDGKDLIPDTFTPEEKDNLLALLHDKTSTA